MSQSIVGYHQDEFSDWVVELECGHCQHIRHNPPWVNRVWTTTKSGRDSKLGEQFFCKKCEESALKDADN